MLSMDFIIAIRGSQTQEFLDIWLVRLALNLQDTQLL